MTVARYVAQGPSHTGKWWVLNKLKGKYGTVVAHSLTEAEAREMARKLNS